MRITKSAVFYISLSAFIGLQLASFGDFHSPARAATEQEINTALELMEVTGSKKVFEAMLPTITSPVVAQIKSVNPNISNDTIKRIQTLL